MFISLFLASAAPLAAAQPLSAGTGALHGPAVVILWATWCASCRAEIERLPKLASASGRLPIRTLAIDPSDLARRTLVARGQPTDNAYADPRPVRTVLDEWGGPGSALPLAIAVDPSGQICGRRQGLLGTDQLRGWAARCSR